jgi:predicted amidohydrolase
VRVACCQIAPDVEDWASNAETATAAIAGATAGGARVVVLPELANSGYAFGSVDETRAAAVPADGELLKLWAREAARSDAVIVTGFCERAPDGRLFNSAALIDGQGVTTVYRKLHLWGDEPRWFSRGDQAAPVVRTRHGAIGLAVCYDLEFPELTRGLALQGAELIAVPANWPRDPHPPDGRPILHSLAAMTAYFNKTYVAVCDRCGTERGQEFEGGSVIAGPDGGLLAGPVPGRDTQILHAECDLERARDKRTGENNDAFGDRRADRYAAELAGG